MRTALPPDSIEILSATSPHRAAVEKFIIAAYARAFGAQLTITMPELMAARDAEGGVVGALGLRCAGEATLFLEGYLDQPVEITLTAASGHAARRESIIEVGHLAAASPGGSSWLIALLTSYLLGLGKNWAVFTGNRALRNAFARLGISMVDLGDAAPERIGASRQTWGSYYDDEPRVTAVGVCAAHGALWQPQPDIRHLPLRQVPAWAAAAQIGLRNSRTQLSVADVA
jgi:hypothetical protein